MLGPTDASHLKVSGPRVLSGDLKAIGSKNSSLAALAASLLTAERVDLHEVPILADVDVKLEILTDLGCKVERQGNTCQIQANFQRPGVPSQERCGWLRSSFYLLGPLLARFGQAMVPLPGGGCHWQSPGRPALGIHAVAGGADISGTGLGLCPYRQKRRKVPTTEGGDSCSGHPNGRRDLQLDDGCRFGQRRYTYRQRRQRA